MAIEDTKVAVVTGAARPWGLGRAAALALARAGFDIAVADIRENWGGEAVADIQAETGRRVTFHLTDVSNRDSVSATIKEVMLRRGRIDALLNVAAVLASERLEDFSDRHYDRIMSVNFRGTVLTCQAVIPIMKRQDGGRIVNVTAAGIWRPVQGLGIYEASKAAVTAFSKTLALEHARDNICVIMVSPGPLPTAMGSEGPPDLDVGQRTARTSMLGRPMTVEEVAGDIVFAATSASMALSGQTLHSNGGFAWP